MLSLFTLRAVRRGSALKRRGAIRQGPRPRSLGRRLRFETVEERRLLSISLGALANKAVAEGSPYSDAIAIVDPGASSYTASVNYGDGTVDNSPTLLNVGGDELLVLDHIYGQTGAYNVTASVQDNLSPQATSNTAAITVSEAAASLSGLPTSAVRECPLSFAESFGDPGWGVQYAYSVSWGDGSSADTGAATIEVSGQAHTPTQGHFDLSHTYSATGTYSVTASLYEVDGGVESTTPIGTQTSSVTVNLPSTTTTLTASASSLLYGNTEVLTAMVGGGASGDTLSGTVQFEDGGAVIGSASVVNGSANLDSTTLAAGSHTFTAVYEGDSLSAGSMSGAVPVTVATISIAEQQPGVVPTTASIAETQAGSPAQTAVAVSESDTPGDPQFTLTGYGTGTSGDYFTITLTFDGTQYTTGQIPWENATQPYAGDVVSALNEATLGFWYYPGWTDLWFGTGNPETFDFSYDRYCPAGICDGLQSVSIDESGLTNGESLSAKILSSGGDEEHTLTFTPSGTAPGTVFGTGGNNGWNSAGSLALTYTGGDGTCTTSNLVGLDAADLIGQINAARDEAMGGPPSATIVGGGPGSDSNTLVIDYGVESPVPLPAVDDGLGPVSDQDTVTFNRAPQAGALTFNFSAIPGGTTAVVPAADLPVAGVDPTNFTNAISAALSGTSLGATVTVPTQTATGFTVDYGVASPVPAPTLSNYLDPGVPADPAIIAQTWTGGPQTAASISETQAGQGGQGATFTASGDSSTDGTLVVDALDAAGNVLGQVSVTYSPTFGLTTSCSVPGAEVTSGTILTLPEEAITLEVDSSTVPSTGDPATLAGLQDTDPVGTEVGAFGSAGLDEQHTLTFSPRAGAPSDVFGPGGWNSTGSLTLTYGSNTTDNLVGMTAAQIDAEIQSASGWGGATIVSGGPGTTCNSLTIDYGMGTPVALPGINDGLDPAYDQDAVTLGRAPQNGGLLFNFSAIGGGIAAVNAADLPVTGVNPTAFINAIASALPTSLGATVTVPSQTATGFTIDYGVDSPVAVPTLGDYLGPGIAQNEVQTLTFSALAHGGSFTLSFDGDTTSPISCAHGLPCAAAVENALAALSDIGSGNVSVSRDGLVYTVTFQGSMADTPEPLLASSVPAVPALTIAEEQTGGPTTANVSETQEGQSGEPAQPATSGGITCNYDYSSLITDPAAGYYFSGGVVVSYEVDGLQYSYTICPSGISGGGGAWRSPA